MMCMCKSSKVDMHHFLVKKNQVMANIYIYIYIYIYKKKKKTIFI